jgi:hypothetical protein
MPPLPNLPHVTTHQNTVQCVRVRVYTAFAVNITVFVINIFTLCTTLIYLYHYATGWPVGGSNTATGPKFSPLQNVQTSCGAHPVSYSMGTGVLSRGKVARMCRTTGLHLVPRLRMSGAIPQLPLYAFMAWRGKTFTFSTLSFAFIRYNSTVIWQARTGARSGWVVNGTPRALYTREGDGVGWVSGRLWIGP